jgi:hypothetical protein
MEMNTRRESPRRCRASPGSGEFAPAVWRRDDGRNRAVAPPETRPSLKMGPVDLFPLEEAAARTTLAQLQLAE